MSHSSNGRRPLIQVRRMGVLRQRITGALTAIAIAER